MSNHEHDWCGLPASDPDNELPFICYECNKVIWGNGIIMSVNQWNSYYDELGELLDKRDNPSKNNPDWIGHKNANESHRITRSSK